MVRSVLRIAAVTALLMAVAWAGEDWKEKPWQEWSADEVREILGESAWVQDHYVTENVAARVRCRSARPVRMAVARMTQLGNPEATPEQLDKMVNEPLFDQYLALSVEFFVDNSRLRPRQFVGGREAALENSRRELRRFLQVLRTEGVKNKTYLINEDNERINVVHYTPPQGQSGPGIFFFPRQMEDGTPTIKGRKRMVFLVEIPELGVRIRREFKLDKMIFDGKLTM